MVTVRRAVVLVGGKGSRLYPYTASFPKPLMPLGDLPILEILLRQLAAADVRRITLALGHLGELIQAYLAHNRRLSDLLQIDFVREDAPLGTAGALSLVPDIDEPFLVMNGDVMTDLNFGKFLDAHAHSGALLSVASYAKRTPIDLGVLETDADGRLIGYIEKPVKEFLVSMGVYAYDPRVLSYIPSNSYLDFPDLVLKMLSAGEVVRAVTHAGLWLDIGRPDDYAEAQQLFADRRLAVLPEL